MSNKHNLEQVMSSVRLWKSEGQRVVFTNGVFDILHLGHVTYLEKAKSLGDKLVIGVNSDESVRRLNKGTNRPVNPEIARAAVLEALRAVDAVIIFNDDTPINVIGIIEPDVLVKGGDYSAEETDPGSVRYMVGSESVKARGGVVIAIPLVEGYSTTGIISKLNKPG